MVWSNGADRIAKLDHATFEVLDEFPVKPMDQWPTDEEIDEAIDTLDSLDCSEGVDSPDCVALREQALQLAIKYLTGIDGVYAVLDKDNTFYIGGSQRVVAYGDAEAANPDSEIVVERTWDIPTDGSVPGGVVGRNVPESASALATRLYASFLGNDSLFQPFGMQKFEWDPKAQKLKEAWANPELSSPNSVPYISLFSGTQLDQEGRITYGNPFGRLRLDVN